METTKYFFPDTEAGLTLMLYHTITRRKMAGVRTRATVEIMAHFPVHVLEVTAAPRPNRKERGCYIKGATL